MEVSSFAKEMSVCLFSKNYRAIGTRFYSQPDKSEYLPTIALCGNGSEVVVDVYWQTQILSNCNFSVVCIPL